MTRRMKYSGHDWLGEIPEDWTLTSIGNVYAERNEKVSDTDYPPLSVTMNGIVPQLDSVVKTDDRSNRKKVLRNDFVINSRSDRRGAYGVSEYDGSCSVINIVLQPNDIDDSRYYNYVLFTKSFPDEFYRWGNGIVADLWTTRWNSMRKIQLPMPPKEERKAIVEFLDKRCEVIDAAVQKTKETIEEYRSLRSSIISETIFSGLFPGRRLKPSKVKWIGDIPENWAIIPSKYLFSNSDRRRDDSDELLTSSQKYGIITQKEYMQRENSKIVQATQGLDDWKHVEPNEFIISLRSFQGGLEMSETTGCITWHYIVLKAAMPICHKYYKWVFKSPQYINALQATCNFIRDGQDLRYSNFVQVPLVLPPIEDQELVADYLEKICGAIDRLILKKEKLVDELVAYKKTLIYEYVTGKKEI